MLTKTILAAGALISMVAAVPLQQNKREVVWETKVEEAYVTVDVTTTIWLNPGETPPVVPAGGAESPGHYGHGNHGHKPKTTSRIKHTVTVPAPSEQPTEVTPVPETSTSPYVAPVPTTTTTPVAPVPTTSAPTTPAPVESTAPVESSTPPAYTAPQPTQPSGGAPSGQTFTGDLTYYAPGLGSCGETNSDSEAIVALAENMMSAMTPASGNPNDNPLCGKSITISYGGKTATAKIMDTCPGCANGGLDLTSSLFEVFAPLGEGRLTGMKWWYN